MDSTLISTPHHLFAYCITDGVLDEMTEEQKASIISIIESLLSEGEEDANSERLLSGEDASAYSKKKFFFTRENKSIFGCYESKKLLRS
jgi:hypothetical protein